MSKNVTALIEVGLFAALAMVLSFIPDFVGWFSPSFGAIPLVFFSLRRGLSYGLLAGLIWGLLHFLLGKVYYLSLEQVLLEYILAFLVMGLAGIVSTPFKNALQDTRTSLSLFYAFAGASIAIFVRYLIHYIAGILFWSSYAPEGMSAEWYSITVNGTAGGATLFVTLLALGLIVPAFPAFFSPKK